MTAAWVLIIGIVIFLYILQPLLRKQLQGIGSNLTFDRFSDLHQERERSYIALAELDFDYDCGKISEADYHKLRGELLIETAAILAQIDQLSASERDRQERRKHKVRDSAHDSAGDSIEDEIERYKRSKAGQK